MKTDFYAALEKLSNSMWEEVICRDCSDLFAFFEKCLHFGAKLPYIKSGFSKNQGGIQKLEFKTNLQHP